MSGMNKDLDVIIVGAGFAGLYALRRLRSLGFKAKIFEAGSGVGGTWFWNRYPGARCDTESMEYSYQFDDQLQQDWTWTERFAAQPEILRYAEHVAERFDLYTGIELNTRVLAATFEEPDTWVIETDKGDITRARYCIMGLGCLSSPSMPEIDGAASYTGTILHTGLWPAGHVDLAGRSVGVIGTGSSGVQVTTSLADEVGELLVFQRTPNYVVPSHNRPLIEQKAAEVKSRYSEFRAEAKTTGNGHHPGPYGIGTKSALEVSASERHEEYQCRWDHGGLSFLSGFKDLLTDPEANLTASEFVRAKIRSAVKDPQIANLLCPDYGIGGKRLCVGSGYYEMYNKSHVNIVDASCGIDAITYNGILVNGKEYKVDCIIFATGYDAFTGSLLRIDIRGRGGVSLREKWSSGPLTYLGLAISEFPNMFMITGPGSPSVLTNVLPSIEQHVDWIAECLSRVRGKGMGLIEAKLAAETEWTTHVSDTSNHFLRSSVKSWWNGSNIEGKPQVSLPYMGGFPLYLRKCRDEVANDYEGFHISLDVVTSASLDTNQNNPKV